MILIKRLLLLTTVSVIALTAFARGQTDQPTQAEYEHLQNKIDDLQEKLNAVTRSLNQQSGQIPPLKDKLDKTAQATTVLNQEIVTTKTTDEQKIGEVKSKTEQESADLQKLQAQLATQLQDLQAKLDEAKTATATLDQKLAPMGDKVDKAIQTVTSINTDLQTTKANADKNYEKVSDAATGVEINISWTLITGYLVMFMQAGFAMVETGFTRAKNVAHTMMMNFMVYTIAMLGFWVCGFAIQYGGNGDASTTPPHSVSTVTSLGSGCSTVLGTEWGFTLGGKYFGLMGGAGYFLQGASYDAGIFTLFLFEMVFMDTAATIPTGAMAERWRFLPFSVFSFFVGALIYPVFGNWVWGGGWLAALGVNFGLGHGHVDFAGSSVVHMVGGVMALVGAWWLGPRIGKYNKDGTPNPIPGHNIPMAIVGTFILAFGWFGFNPGSTLSSVDSHIGIIATNTMLASAGGAVAAMIVAWIRIGKPDPSLACNGMLAGLVAITAPCAFVDSWAAVSLGAIAGVIMYFSVFFVEERLRIDDPVGAISVHGTCGAWGVISLGIFANGKYGDGWNGVAGNVRGICTWNADGTWNPDWTQVVAELCGVCTNFLWVGGSSLLILFVIEKALGGNRTSAEAEIEGLDGPEMGAIGYTNAP